MRKGCGSSKEKQEMAMVLTLRKEVMTVLCKYCMNCKIEDLLQRNSNFIMKWHVCVIYKALKNWFWDLDFIGHAGTRYIESFEKVHT